MSVHQPSEATEDSHDTLTGRCSFPTKTRTFAENTVIQFDAEIPLTSNFQ